MANAELPFSQAIPVADESPAAQLGGLLHLPRSPCRLLSLPRTQGLQETCKSAAVVLLRYFSAAHLSC